MEPIKRERKYSRIVCCILSVPRMARLLVAASLHVSQRRNSILDIWSGGCDCWCSAAKRALCKRIGRVHRMMACSSKSAKDNYVCFGSKHTWNSIRYSDAPVRVTVCRFLLKSSVKAVGNDRPVLCSSSRLYWTFRTNSSWVIDLFPYKAFPPSISVVFSSIYIFLNTK